MLQQTTVATVSARFEPFVAQFPNVRALAKGEEDEILSAWRGLGYYRRAKNLHRGARHLMLHHGGRFPLDESALKTIPGIGEYTAAALTGIGRNRPALPLDANLKRVLARFLAVESKDIKGELQRLFGEGRLLPEAKMESLGSRVLIEALMDLGRTFCRANGVRCEECPLRAGCGARLSGRPLSYGIPQKSPSPLLSLELLRVVVWRPWGVLAYPKGKGQWLEGQWELPTFVFHCEDARFSQYPPLETNISMSSLPTIPSRITRYRIRNHILSCGLEQFREKFPSNHPWQFYRPDSDPCLLSSTTLKILDKTKPHQSL